MQERLKQMLKVDVVIYDFDGVIIDSAGGIANAVRETQKHFGTEIFDTDRIVSYVGFGAKYLIDGCFPTFSEKQRKTALDWYKAFYRENCLVDTVLYPTVMDTLEFFHKKGIPQFIVSNKPEPITKRILEKLNVAQLFQAAYGPESLSKMKPDPEGLVKCLESSGRKNGIMVGDSYTDIIAGKAAGIHTCGATYGMGDRAKLKAENADIYVEKLGDMLKYIDVN